MPVFSGAPDATPAAAPAGAWPLAKCGSSIAVFLVGPAGAPLAIGGLQGRCGVAGCHEYPPTLWRHLLCCTLPPSCHVHVHGPANLLRQEGPLCGQLPYVLPRSWKSETQMQAAAPLHGPAAADANAAAIACLQEFMSARSLFFPLPAAVAAAHHPMQAPAGNLPPGAPPLSSHSHNNYREACVHFL